MVQHLFTPPSRSFSPRESDSQPRTERRDSSVDEGPTVVCHQPPHQKGMFQRLLLTFPPSPSGSVLRDPKARAEAGTPPGWLQPGRCSQSCCWRGTNRYVRRLPKGFSQNPPVPPAGTAGASLLVPPFAFPAHNLLLWTLIKGLIHNIRGSPASSSRQDAPRSTQSIPLLSAPSALFVCTARAFALRSGLTLPRLVPDTPANTRSPFSRAHFPKKGNPNLKPKPFLLFP